MSRKPRYFGHYLDESEIEEFLRELSDEETKKEGADDPDINTSSYSDTESQSIDHLGVIRLDDSSSQQPKSFSSPRAHSSEYLPKDSPKTKTSLLPSSSSSIHTFIPSHMCHACNDVPLCVGVTDCFTQETLPSLDD